MQLLRLAGRGRKVILLCRRKNRHKERHPIHSTLPGSKVYPTGNNLGQTFCYITKTEKEIISLGPGAPDPAASLARDPRRNTMGYETVKIQSTFEMFVYLYVKNIFLTFLNPGPVHNKWYFVPLSEQLFLAVSDLGWPYHLQQRKTQVRALHYIP